MRNRTLSRVVVIASIVSSCGSREVAGTTQADPPAPTTVATPSTTGPSAAVSYGPTVLVTGSEECELNPPIAAGTTTTDSDGTVKTRDGRFKCTVTNSDPRIAGTAIYTANLDRWTTTGTDGVQVQWGTIRIENEGGAWETEYIGIFSLETGEVGAELFTDTGDYEGLYYYQWVIGTLGQPRPTSGLIFPTTVPIP